GRGSQEARLRPMTPSGKTHSKIGIVACAGGAAMFLFFLVGCFFFFRSWPESEYPFSQLVNLMPMILVLLLPIPVHVLGLVLGVVSLFFPKRRVLFPILAIILNLMFGILS